jgi:hypothetical protein
MVADFKSHILRREERGAFGIPFRRLLFAGMAGGITYALLQGFGTLTGVPFALVVGVAFLILTAPQGGIPRWQRVAFGVQGWLMLVALNAPESLPGRAARLLRLSGQELVLDGETLFCADDEADTQAVLRDWVVYTRASATDGLAVQDRALTMENR